MKFNEMLRYFLNLTGEKSGDLAKFVGYDISYISKWSSGVKIPSEMTSDEVLNKVSIFFSKSIWSQELVDGVVKLSPRKIMIDNYSCLYSLIRRFFTDSYSMSLNLQEDYKNSQYTKKSLTVFGEKRIADFTLETIYRFTSTSTNDIKINMNLTYNKSQDIIADKNYMISEILLLTKSSDIDFRIFQTDGLGDVEVLLLEDSFVIFYITLPDGSKIATYTEEENSIRATLRNLKSIFDKSEIAVDISDDIDIEYSMLEKMIKPDAKFLGSIIFGVGT